MSPKLASERFFSVTAEDALELGFAPCQARSGWVSRLLSPSGEISYYLKGDVPRINEDGKPIKYEGRMGYEHVLDLGSLRNYARVVGTPEDVWVTEGAKKGACLETLGKVVITLPGTWTWGKKREHGGEKYGRPELLPDWGLIPIEGRRINIAFDSDFRQKPSVALAMLRLAERLTERGAKVYIACPPGPEKGVDDYVVAGRGVAELEKNATPFDPVHLLPYVANARDGRVHAIVDSLLARMTRDEWGGRGDHTPHSLLRAMLELALERGRYDKEGEFVTLIASQSELLVRAGIGSKSTLSRADRVLADRGYYEKESGDHNTGKANRYRLKLSVGVLEMERESLKDPESSTTSTGTAKFAPHFRWPAPVVLDSRDGPESQLPPLDPNPKDPPPLPDLPSVYTEAKSSVSAEPREPGLEASVGKVAERALWTLLRWGGRATIGDLAKATGVNHTTKMRKHLAPLEAAGVVGMDAKGKHGAEVWVEEDWERRAMERKERDGEYARTRRQAVKLREAKEAYHAREENPAEGEPELMGPEEFAVVHEKQRQGEKMRWIEEQRQKVGESAATFLADEMDGVVGMRYAELCQRWSQKGGSLEDLRTAVLYGPWFFHREVVDKSTYVYWSEGPMASYAGPNDKLWKERHKKAEDEDYVTL